MSLSCSRLSETSFRFPVGNIRANALIEPKQGLGVPDGLSANRKLSLCHQAGQVARREAARVG